MTCFKSHSNLVSKWSHVLGFLIPCHHSAPWNAISIVPAKATMHECLCQAHCWNTSVSDFDERAEAGGSCSAFCLISSSITLIDLPALANSEEFACLWIFHCITMLPINIWISTVLLPLEKDASEDICILSVVLLLFSERQIESQGLLEDRQNCWQTSTVDLIMPLCYVPLSQHNQPFCLKSSQKCPVVCLCRCAISLWWSLAFYFDILPPSGALALSLVPTLLSL